MSGRFCKNEKNQSNREKELWEKFNVNVVREKLHPNFPVLQSEKFCCAFGTLAQNIKKLSWFLVTMRLTFMEINNWSHQVNCFAIFCRKKIRNENIQSSSLSFFSFLILPMTRKIIYRAVGVLYNTYAWGVTAVRKPEVEGSNLAVVYIVFYFSRLVSTFLISNSKRQDFLYKTYGLVMSGFFSTNIHFPT